MSTPTGPPRSPLAARLHRARTVLADRAYPGGLVAHHNPPVAPPPPPDLRRIAPDDAAVITDLAERTVPVDVYTHRHGPLFQELVAQFGDADRDALRPLLPEDEHPIVADGDDPDRVAVSIGLALHYGLPGIAERTGLSAATPPAEIHSMNPEPFGTGGDPWYADAIDIALREVGAELGPGMRVLDFGCSSGRIVRMLAARRPQVEWEGIDVNAKAIAWAGEALPGIRFTHQSAIRPPLPFADGRFDAVYAISIWSHYDAEASLVWLEELRRIVKPGGHVFITTHGASAVAARAGSPDHGPEAQIGILPGLYRDGFVFVDSFGGQGDWGVVDSGWGVSFMTPEWLLAHVTPAWQLALYRPAAIQHHQDLYVLRRAR